MDDGSRAKSGFQRSTPVPIYFTYLTAQVNEGQLSFVDDTYGRDEQAMRVAALK